MVTAIMAAGLLAAAPASQPATAPIDPALWTRLQEIDARAGHIRTLAAAFEQQKFTPLLRKPLVSQGRVRISGPLMRWDTQQPQPSVLLIDQHEARVYYPSQRVMEIYPLDKRLGELAASPLPRLDVLRARFAFRQVPASELDPSADPKRFIALVLTPTESSLSQYVSQVRVLLDSASACVTRAEITDVDGERSLLLFKDARPNVDVGDLHLAVPPGTKITHPLEGLDGQPPPRDKSN